MTPELYLRWLAVGVFSSNFVLEGVEKLLPWAFGEETLAHARTWLQWRYRLIPYVLGAVEDAVRTGLPVQRSMAHGLPRTIPTPTPGTLQYLLGPALLVAPILEPGRRDSGLSAQGRGLVGSEHGPPLRRRYGLDRDLRSGPVSGLRPRRPYAVPGRRPRATRGEFNSARILDEVWMFGMPMHNPVVMRNKIRVMQMQGSSYIKGLEGLRILSVRRAGGQTPRG